MKNSNGKDIAEIAAICANCGSCLSACPVYNAELVEPDSPRGKINIIKALWDGSLKPGRLNQQILYKCLVCGSCESVCSKSVEYLDLMIGFRNRYQEQKGLPRLKKLLLFLYQSLLFKKMVFLLDILVRTPLKNRMLLPARKKARLTDLTTSPDDQAYDVLFFPGCVLTFFYPALIEDIVRLLRQGGFSVALPPGLNCCGFPYISQGWTKRFAKLKKKNEKQLSHYKFKYLVAPCSTCVMALKKYYPQLGQTKIFDLTGFMYRFQKGAKLSFPDQKTGKKLTYHDPCHSLKTLGLKNEARYFLNQKGSGFVDDQSELCCGFGGIFSIGYKKTSARILKKRERQLDNTGADTVVTSCPGCYMYLKENLDKQVKFFSEIFEIKQK